MNRSQRIFKNSAVLFFMPLSTRLLALFLVIGIARSLGQDVLGQYLFLLSFTIVIAVLSDLGLATLVIRFLAREPQKISKEAFNLYSLKILRC